MIPYFCVCCLDDGLSIAARPGGEGAAEPVLRTGRDQGQPQGGGPQVRPLQLVYFSLLVNSMFHL